MYSPGYFNMMLRSGNIKYSEEEKKQLILNYIKTYFELGNAQPIEIKKLEEIFFLYIPYLKCIQSGEILSNFHNTFNTSYETSLTMKYFEYSMVFHEENLQTLCQLMSKQLPTSYQCYSDQMNYNLKVLLPELIIKIVMDAYSVSKTAAFEKLLQLCSAIADKFEF